MDKDICLPILLQLSDLIDFDHWVLASSGGHLLFSFLCPELRVHAAIQCLDLVTLTQFVLSFAFCLS